MAYTSLSEILLGAMHSEKKGLTENKTSFPEGFLPKKGLIDCHCHLEYMDETVIEEATQRMQAVVTSVAHPKDAVRMLEVAKKHKGFVYLALGLHPSEVVKFTDEQINEYCNMVRQNKSNIVAIGEVGLDRHWIKDEAEHKRSKSVFKKFIELANEINVPLVIHTRDDKSSGISVMDETLDLLQHAKVPVMMHCFSSREHITECEKRGYYMSMNTILYKSKSYGKIARDCPLDLIVLETDSPWMDPQSSELTNRPWKIEQAAEKIAELKHMSKEEILRTTTENAKKLFGI
ncbi:MAG TPA: TatD family hydrolase [archaeon]|nr:TatD family hydrolase [archaeon]